MTAVAVALALLRAVHCPPEAEATSAAALVALGVFAAGDLAFLTEARCSPQRVHSSALPAATPHSRSFHTVVVAAAAPLSCCSAAQADLASSCPSLPLVCRRKLLRLAASPDADAPVRPVPGPTASTSQHASESAAEPSLGASKNALPRVKAHVCCLWPAAPLNLVASTLCCRRAVQHSCPPSQRPRPLLLHRHAGGRGRPGRAAHSGGPDAAARVGGRHPAAQPQPGAHTHHGFTSFPAPFTL